MAAQKIAIAVHGGAKPFSSTVQANQGHYEKGLRDAAATAYDILQGGGSALDAVEAAIRMLEDNPHFNAGRGSALNEHGQVEMDASIMDGATLRAGGVSIIQKVKNPVTVARAIMEKTSHILLGGPAALSYARQIGAAIEVDTYFITEEQLDAFMEKVAENTRSNQVIISGTVGAVALDAQGNVAAATSTGGNTFQMAGRIGDSCMIGAGTYADNRHCAISATGDGELIMQGFIAHDISAVMRYQGLGLQAACDYVLHERNKHVRGDMGVIALDPGGNVAMAFKSECMPRAWKAGDEEIQVAIK